MTGKVTTFLTLLGVAVIAFWAFRRVGTKITVKVVSAVRDWKKVVNEQRSVEFNEDRARIIEDALYYGMLKGFPMSYLLAVIDVESNFDPYAESIVGAKGLFQIKPIAAYDAGWSYMPTDPLLQAKAGIDYLALQRDRVRNDIRRGYVQLFTGTRVPLPENASLYELGCVSMCFYSRGDYIEYLQKLQSEGTTIDRPELWSESSITGAKYASIVWAQYHLWSDYLLAKRDDVPDVKERNLHAFY